MKHYCNRQSTRKNSHSDKIISQDSPKNSTTSDKSSDCPVFPPGIDYSGLKSTPFSDTAKDDEAPEISEDMCEFDISKARGGAISQMSGYCKHLDINNTLYGGRGAENMLCYGWSNSRQKPNELYYDNMSGSFATTSVPQPASGGSLIPISVCLNKYISRFVCLSLWSSNCTQEEMCGFLTDVGNDFLTIQREGDSCCTMIDLKTVRYINIYCR